MVFFLFFSDYKQVTWHALWENGLQRCFKMSFSWHVNRNLSCLRALNTKNNTKIYYVCLITSVNVWTETKQASKIITPQERFRISFHFKSHSQETLLLPTFLYNANKKQVMAEAFIFWPSENDLKAQYTINGERFCFAA